MINEKLINMFLQNVEQEDLIRGVKELLNHLKIQSNYAFEKQVNNFINIVGGDKPISINDIDIEFIKSNIDKFVYKSEEINKDSIKISNIDTIDNSFEIVYKRNEDNYNSTFTIDYDSYVETVKEN